MKTLNTGWMIPRSPTRGQLILAVASTLCVLIIALVTKNGLVQFLGVLWSLILTTMWLSFASARKPKG